MSVVKRVTVVKIGNMLMVGRSVRLPVVWIFGDQPGLVGVGMEVG